MADLITAQRATLNSTLSSLSGTNPALLDALISAASQNIQRHCHRDFVQTTYTEYLSGPNYPYAEIILRQCPIISIDRIATNPQPVLQIQNNNTTSVSRATVNTTSTGIVLKSVDGTTGATTTTTLLYATYPVVNSMAAAIGLVSGWTASVIGAFGIYPTADLKPIQGAQTALFGPAVLSIYVEDRYSYIGAMGGATDNEEWDLSCSREQFRVDDEAGIIYGRFPRGQWNIRVDYTAGFATVPPDVQEATVQHIQDLYQAAGLNSNISKATLGQVSYQTKVLSEATQLSGKVSGLVRNYILHDRVIAR